MMAVRVYLVFNGFTVKGNDAEEESDRTDSVKLDPKTPAYGRNSEVLSEYRNINPLDLSDTKIERAPVIEMEGVYVAEEVGLPSSS